MGCSTWIYKRITEKNECIHFINNAIQNAKENIEWYTVNSNEYFNTESEEFKESVNNFNDYIQDVKKGYFIYDTDIAFCYMSNGKWIYRFELSLEDVIEECINVISKCQTILNEQHTFEELKYFIIENFRYFGFDFSDPYVYDCETDTDNSYIQYSFIKIYNDEIYVYSDAIQHDAFANCSYFRIYGYPCESVPGCPIYYQDSPAGKLVYGWTNADELIDFLEWYKTADDKNPRFDEEGERIVTDLPQVQGNHCGYNDMLYSAIRNFFKVNKNKGLLVHFS